MSKKKTRKRWISNLCDYFEDGAPVYTGATASLNSYVETLTPEEDDLEKDWFAEFFFADEIKVGGNSVKSLITEAEDNLEAISEAIPEKTKISVSNTAGKQNLSVFAVAQDIIERANIIAYGGLCYHYNGECYEQIDEKRMQTLACKYLDKKILHSLSNLKFITDVHTCIKLTEYIDVNKQLDRKGDGRYVTFKNGTVDVLTGILYPHSSDYLTFYCLDAEYITGEEIETPGWDEFLNTSLDSELAKELVMAMIGYLISPFISAKKFFVMGNASNSGKSVVASFLESVIEEKYVSHIAMGDLNGNFALEPLVGKVLNLSMDLPDVVIQQKAVSKLKMITGLDTVSVNIKYEREISYFNRAKFLFSTNFPLRFKSWDAALMERLVFVPFMKSVPKSERDKDLLQKLLEERDGILTKAIWAARKLYKNGFAFPGEEQFRMMGVEQMKASDEVTEAFLEGRCIIDTDGTGFTATIDLYGAYTEFCTVRYITPLAEAKFSKEVTDITGIVKSRGEVRREDGSRSQPRGFKGITLLE